MTPADEAVARVIARVKDELEAESALLFGSRARGEAGPDSDYDVCFLFADLPGRALDMMRRARIAIHRDTSVPLDILVYRSDEFKALARQMHTFEHEIQAQALAL